MTSGRFYAAIDLKSYYASVECVDRGLNPLTTNLVVADLSRTQKTICLAVSPSLKAYGIPGRPRLFEVEEKVRQLNAYRRSRAPGRTFSGKSSSDPELKQDPSLELDYIVAPPRMRHYMEVSAQIYGIYLNYVGPEDIHVYSVDEVFIDLTPYLKTHQMTPRELTMTMIREVLYTTGITATAGIATNLYLAKVAMDIVAKKTQPDLDGVRIAELDEQSYRQLLWDHRPLTDFWRVGSGYAKKLEAHGLYTMGDIARCTAVGTPSYNADLLYRLFGVNAELLIDHAWGWEPCTIAQIKAYRPRANSLSHGQVLKEPYPAPLARLVTQEMADLLILELVEKGLVTDQIVLTLGYDVSNLSDPNRAAGYQGAVTTDHYGRRIPKHAHGTIRLDRPTSSTRQLVRATLALYDRIVDPDLLIRRITLVAGNVVGEEGVQNLQRQLDLFTSPDMEQAEQEALEREKRQQQAILEIKRRYGKNAILKGMNFKEGATARERNSQVGGHKA